MVSKAKGEVCDDEPAINKKSTIRTDFKKSIRCINQKIQWGQVLHSRCVKYLLRSSFIFKSCDFILSKKYNIYLMDRYPDAGSTNRNYKEEVKSNIYGYKYEDASILMQIR